jgi:hypothetical protein
LAPENPSPTIHDEVRDVSVVSGNGLFAAHWRESYPDQQRAKNRATDYHQQHFQALSPAPKRSTAGAIIPHPGTDENYDSGRLRNQHIVNQV